MLDEHRRRRQEIYDFEKFGQTQLMEASESLRRVGGGANPWMLARVRILEEVAGTSIPISVERVDDFQGKTVSIRSICHPLR